MLRQTILLLLLFFSVMPLAAQQRDDWPVFGGDPANTKYSPLAQINKNNVQTLQIVWTWKTGEGPLQEYGTAPGRFEATPLMIDDVLYLPTPYNRAVALDANTGKEIWNYDPHAYALGPGPPGVSFATHRGITTWTDGKERRVLLDTRGRLIALGVTTGKPIASFGHEGEIDLTKDLLWEVKKGQYVNSSPPVVYKDLVIVGSNISDSLVYPKSPPGDVQAFDVRTGKRVWTFHTIPQKGEFGNNTWEENSWQVTGHANVWVPFTLDEKRGLVYLPVSTPANDQYGGNRKGNNLFGDSLVCLDANTGKRVWHFQTVHHGLWDYDGLSTPSLLTIHVDGKTIDAVAAASKAGFIYVFDPVTGEPVWPIVERPVPQTEVPGEKTSPTQPFPTQPPAFAKQGFTLDDLVDFTPEIKAMALEKVKGYRYGPIFTPPSVEGTITMPGAPGGANWGGASVDPQTGILYVKGRNNPGLVKLIKQDPKAPSDPSFYGVSEGPYRYAFPVDNLMLAGAVPVIKPPYNTFTAIDLNKGDLLWQIPLGDSPQIRNHPLLKGLSLPPLGGTGNEGVLVTGGGLVFAGTADKKFCAIDKTSGKIIWQGDLEFASAGSPMTYRTRAGRQFVVVATGAGKNATLVAFALPQ